MESYLKKIAEKYTRTCSLFDLRDECVTFVRQKEYLSLLSKTKYSLGVLIPEELFPTAEVLDNVKLIQVHKGADIDYCFTMLHNLINRDKDPEPNKIGKGCVIHNTVILDVPGNTYVEGPTGKRIMMKSMGNVVLGNDVEIAANSIVHTSTMSSTTIKNGVKICVMCNIGHNCFIDENTCFAPGVMVAGGVRIGKNCYLWQGVLIRDNISICDNVTIGIGSVVTKSITEPGVYYGTPCVYRKPYEGLARIVRKIS
jgi:UDP-3-O-[3-hydroxymyristoyl] glucosamine N-acyltransferase